MKLEISLILTKNVRVIRSISGSCSSNYTSFVLVKEWNPQTNKMMKTKALLMPMEDITSNGNSDISSVSFVLGNHLVLEFNLNLITLV